MVLTTRDLVSRKVWCWKKPCAEMHVKTEDPCDTNSMTVDRKAICPDYSRLDGGSQVHVCVCACAVPLCVCVCVCVCICVCVCVCVVHRARINVSNGRLELEL